MVVYMLILKMMAIALCFGLVACNDSQSSQTTDCTDTISIENVKNTGHVERPVVQVEHRFNIILIAVAIRFITRLIKHLPKIRTFRSI